MSFTLVPFPPLSVSRQEALQLTVPLPRHFNHARDDELCSTAFEVYVTAFTINQPHYKTEL